MCESSSVVTLRPLAVPDRASEARPGLVSVPTSQKPFEVLAASDALREELGGFVPSEKLRRIACLRRAVGFAARAHSHPRPGLPPDKVVMLTATYRTAEDWRPKHVAALLDHVRHWSKVRSIQFRYVWVAELQQRGAVHYHVAIWLPIGEKLPFADAQGWWPHGMTNTEEARAAVPYLMKYLSKGSSIMRLPHRARMYGVGGLSPELKLAARWLRHPSFVQARADIFDDWRRAPGGGWHAPSGSHFSSEFQRVWLGDAYGLLRVENHGRPFEAAGPFTWLHRQAGAAREVT